MTQWRWWLLSQRPVPVKLGQVGSCKCPFASENLRDTSRRNINSKVKRCWERAAASDPVSVSPLTEQASPICCLPEPRRSAAVHTHP
ncbi:hypothetical protein GN956_G852 [Arapaima gigas]